MQKHVIWLLMLSFSIFSQDRISATYSYTYGDSESLVQARETCKALALRAALESYQVVVSSVTEVANFTLQEDLITTLSTGTLKDVSIDEEQEEGRTLTLTVSATVSPEEVQQAVDEWKASQTGQAPTAEDSLLQFFKEAESRFTESQGFLASSRLDQAQSGMDDFASRLRKWGAHKKAPFFGLMIASAESHSRLVNLLVKWQRAHSNGRRAKAAIHAKGIKKEADDLRGQLKKLESLKNLGDVKQRILKKWVSVCRNTLHRVNQLPRNRRR